MRKILLSVFFWSLACFARPTWTPENYHKRTGFLAELNKVLLPSKDLKDLIQDYRGIYKLHLQALKKRKAFLGELNKVLLTLENLKDLGQDDRGIYDLYLQALKEFDKVLLSSEDLKDLIQDYREILDLHLQACPTEPNKVPLPSEDFKDLIQDYRRILDLHLKACPDEQLELLPLFEKVSNSKWKFRGVIKIKPSGSYLEQFTPNGYLRDKPFSDYMTVEVVAEQDIKIAPEQDIKIAPEQDASFFYAKKIPQARQSSRSERAKRKKMGEREKREQLREQMADY